MMRFVRRSCATIAFLRLALPLCAVDVPKDTQLEVRLQSKISTATAHSKDPISVVVIAPVKIGQQYVIPAGAVVHGAVTEVVHPATATDRASLLLSFTGLEMGGSTVPLQARVAAVDNAREHVDEVGKITGILASETATGRLDS